MHGDDLLWARGFSGKVGDPVVRDGSLIVTIPDPLSASSVYDNFDLVRLDPRTGKTLWTYASSARDSARSRLRCAAIDGVVSSAANVLYGLDSKSGLHLWAMGKMPIAQTIAGMTA